MAKKTTSEAAKTVIDITHEEAKRSNIPTSELKPLVAEGQKAPLKVAYEKRNAALDPQLIWRGKYDGDDTLTVKAPPLYIQEKIHPKALIENLRAARQESWLSLFADFNGIPQDADKTDFYQHEQNWTNRMILGDSLQVMASLAERENLRGKVQAIYIDPPYGIKFNSNFQWSTNSRDVKDGKDYTREPEQVKAFRDTWEDGIHSYLSYLRDRLIVARDLLTESGSIFVQIGDENVHLVRVLMDEVFGKDNFVSLISIVKTSGFAERGLPSICDYIIWYGKDKSQTKINDLKLKRSIKTVSEQFKFLETDFEQFLKLSNDQIFGREPIPEGKRFMLSDLTGQGTTNDGSRKLTFRNKEYAPTVGRHWSTNDLGIERLRMSDRLFASGKGRLGWKKFDSDSFYIKLTNQWNDTAQGGMALDKIYVVQTNILTIQRCILMATDPGDLVLDPTCGSGTTAYVAEQWGRRWITIDTSRVALALARARLMGAKYPYYLMADSREGQLKEAQITGRPASQAPCGNNIALGFVYERVPRITLKSIANNTQIDEIWDKCAPEMDKLRQKLNQALGRNLEEWEMPRYPEDEWPKKAKAAFGKIQAGLEGTLAPLPKPGDYDKWLAEINEALGRDYKDLESLPERPADPWPAKAIDLHGQWWDLRKLRQKEIDESIAAKADFEYLYDKPYEDAKKVRVTGPFTVESISPYRVLNVDEDDRILDPAARAGEQEGRDFAAMILENLKAAGVQQAHKEDRISFTALEPFTAGALIAATGYYMEGDQEKRAAIFIGPEFGTVSREDLVEAAREAGDEKFDILVACAFNFEANTEELKNRGYLPILKARMNAELHMGDALRKTDKGNLFVVFGEPDIELEEAGENQIRVKINGVDVYNPTTGDIVSDNANDIACWFIDTNYNSESFFARQAYFLGQKNPYDSLRRALNAEIDQEAWESLNSNVSRPFPRPETGRIAVKVINHLGDEVMKVFRI